MDDIKIYSINHTSKFYPGLDSDWLINFHNYGDTLSKREIIIANKKYSLTEINTYFSELTAHYILWKSNLELKYVGVCHFRRYFNFIPLGGHLTASPKIYCPPDSPQASILSDAAQKHSALEILKTYDIIIARPGIMNDPMSTAFKNSHGELYWNLFIHSILEHLPKEYQSQIDFFDKEHKLIPYPIFICHKTLFHEFCDLLFLVLFQVFTKGPKTLDLTNERFKKHRYCAFLSERFLNFFIHVNRLRAFEAQLWTLETSA